MAEVTVTLYRPCSLAELELVEASGFKNWPPRLPEQPIFYPVTSEAYARAVNRWNLDQYGAGAITRFEVRKQFMDRYPIQRVGNDEQTEWWIPAEDLAEMNANIVGSSKLSRSNGEVKSQPPRPSGERGQGVRGEAPSSRNSQP